MCTSLTKHRNLSAVSEFKSKFPFALGFRNFRMCFK
jgi:hypothetical protein